MVVYAGFCNVPGEHQHVWFDRKTQEFSIDGVRIPRQVIHDEYNASHPEAHEIAAQLAEDPSLWDDPDWWAKRASVCGHSLNNFE